MDKTNKENTTNTTNTTKIIKIRTSTDIEINGRLYFIADKYISTSFIYMPYEYQQLYKIIIAMYLDILITTNKILNISKITKLHIANACNISDRLINYIITGKQYIVNITSIEKQIINQIPESFVNNINPNIVENL